MTAMHDYAGVAAWNFKLKAEVHSFVEALSVLVEYLDYGNPLAGDEAPLGPNMRVRQGLGYVAIVLYDTEIIRYYPNGTFSVDNGGYNTITTTERLQAVLPDGFRCYHFSTKEIKGKLGLIYGYSPWPKRRKIQTPDTLWPLDHSKRITLDGRFA